MINGNDALLKRPINSESTLDVYKQEQVTCCHFEKKLFKGFYWSKIPRRVYNSLDFYVSALEQRANCLFRNGLCYKQ